MQSEIRQKLLAIFADHPNEFISGQMISEELGCSRTAVWKHIEELRKAGYELEAKQKKGYRIIKIPDKISGNEIKLGLETKKIGQFIHYEESVSSTQKIAHQLANEGCREGTIVVAEEQTKGKGRLDRQWHSPKYTGLWFSVILRPNIPPYEAPQLTLLAATSIVSALHKVTGLPCEIKWPNDILIEGKKLVGILTELQADADRIQAVIIGIGVNVNQQQSDFPAELAEKATSLQIASGGKKWKRAQILQAILLELELLYEQYLEHGFSVIKTLWETYSNTIGNHIIARTLQGELAGKAKRITDEGVLIVEDERGIEHRIYSADIEISSRI